QTPRYLLIEPADSNPSSGTSPPSQPGTITPEDLELLLEEGLASSEPLSLEEISERYESICLPSTASVTEQDTPKRWKQLEQVADLQAEVVLLRGHKACCEHTTLSLLRELLQVHACLQLQDSELKRLQQAAQAPEKEALQNQNQMQTLNKRAGPKKKQFLCARLVEVREALTQIRRKQALQDSERKGAEQEASLRLSELTEKLKQEERDREVTCGALQKSQEEASQRVDHEVARMQAQMTKLREEMSLRFLRREAKLCSFLQKSFLALEKVGACRRQGNQSPSPQLTAGGQEECHLLEQCRGLDKAVVQLTEFVRQNQASLSHVLLAEQKAWWGQLENSRAGELATYLQESLEAMQLASELAQQEMHSALELVRRQGQGRARRVPRLCRQYTQPGLPQLREKSQALEVSVAELVRQVKDMSDHFLALSWRLDLQEQTLSLRLCEIQSEWGVAEQRWQEGLARCQGEAEAHLREVQQRVDILPQQLLREGNPGRKIAEIQGKLATHTEEMATLRSSVMHLWSEEGPWALTLGSRRVLMSLVRQQFFIKDVAPDEVVPVNHWGVYQAVRPGFGAGRTPRAVCRGRVRAVSRVSGQVAAVESGPHEAGGPAEAEGGLGEAPRLEARPLALIPAPFPEINMPAPC
ncbi:hypothetical protein E2I00_009270, partial [Balaenoptera physalus]